MLHPGQSMSFPPFDLKSSRYRQQKEHIIPPSPSGESYPSEPIQIPNSARRRLQFSHYSNERTRTDSGFDSPSWKPSQALDFDVEKLKSDQIDCGSIGSNDVFLFEEEGFDENYSSSPSRRPIGDHKSYASPSYHNLERMRSIQEGCTTPSGSFNQGVTLHFQRARACSLQSPSSCPPPRSFSALPPQRNQSSPVYVRERRVHSFGGSMGENLTPRKDRTYSGMPLFIFGVFLIVLVI